MYSSSKNGGARCKRRSEIGLVGGLNFQVNFVRRHTRLTSIVVRRGGCTAVITCLYATARGRCAEPSTHHSEEKLCGDPAFHMLVWLGKVRGTYKYLFPALAVLRNRYPS